MEGKERFRIAYENVSFNADTTWSEQNDSYKLANKNLLMKEHRLNNVQLIEERPKTVRDLIPESKLATYGNYEYDEAREHSYTKYIQKTQIEQLPRNNPKECDEPWMLPEVDQLFMWYNSCQNSKMNEFGPFESSYNVNIQQQIPEMDFNSPLLNAKNFEEKKLKKSIVSDNVKSIWNNLHDKEYNRKCMELAKEIELALGELSKSYGVETTGPLLDTPDLYRHLEVVEEQNDTNKSVLIDQQQSSTILNDINEVKNENFIHEEPENDKEPKRLYSAVLQGITKNNENTKKPELNNNIQNVEKTSNSPPTFTILTSKTRRNNNEKDKLTTTTATTVTTTSTIPTVVTTTTTTTRPYCSSKPLVKYEPLRKIEDNSSYPLKMSSSYQYQQQYNVRMLNNLTSNTYSYNSQIVTSRQGQIQQQQQSQQQQQQQQRQYQYIPTQRYQYRQPLLMLQQNCTSVYPLTSQLSSTYPYYIEPFQQTRIMQRLIVPQYYTYSNHIYHQLPQYPQQYPQQQQQQQQQQINYYKNKTQILTRIKDKLDKSANTDTINKNSVTNTTITNTITTTTRQIKILDEFDELVLRTVNFVLEEEEDVPITCTVSEELEIQALEQYYNSTDNVYRDLERQAAEQYEDV